MFAGAFEHLVVALLGWLVGAVGGIAAGYGFAVLLRKLSSGGAKHGLVATLAPWRTVVVGLLLINLVPVIPVVVLGLGYAAGVASVAFVIFLCAVVVTVESVGTGLVAASAVGRMASWSRSLAVFSVVLATHYGFFGGGGLGGVFRESINLLEYERAFVVWCWVVGLALLIDLATGGIQFIVESRAVGDGFRVPRRAA